VFFKEEEVSNVGVNTTLTDSKQKKTQSHTKTQKTKTTTKNSGHTPMMMGERASPSK
jgi:hypothetical protein